MGVLLDAILTDAVTGAVTDPVTLPAGCASLALQAAFTYGSGGTSAKAWVQTSLDGGATWCDIACFAFATTTARKASALTVNVALAAATAPTDGTMADNAILNGLLGSQFRVKYTTVGTYADDTRLQIHGVSQ